MQESAEPRTTIEPRRDLVDARERAWERLASPGPFLDGTRRIEIAAEVRHARNCTFCAGQKKALSPNSVQGVHDTRGNLSAGEIELIHRLTNDSGRLSEEWYQGCLAGGLTEGAFIEATGVICTIIVLDTFALAMDWDEEPLPSPRPGTPSAARAVNARHHDAWVPYVEPEDVVPEDGWVYQPGMQAPVLKALSLIPEVKRTYWDLVDAHYLPYEELWNFSCDLRALGRAQLEVIAARTSALHQCMY